MVTIFSVLHKIQPRGTRLFYGWWIVAGGAAVMAMSAGLNFYGFSAFFVPLNEEFGWNRAVLAGVFAMSRLEGGFLGPVEGYFVDRFGPRRMMLIGVPLMAVGFMLFSRVNSLLAVYLVYILAISLGGGIGSFTAVSAAVANWFSVKRSRAFGVVMSGVAVGGGVLVPVLGWWISTYGWRSAAVASGLLTLALGMPIALLMRHKPEDYGYLPDGATPTGADEVSGASPGAGGKASPREEQAEFGPLQSLKTRAFWFLGISQALRAFVTTGVTIHFVAMMVDRGFSFTAASGLLGMVAFLSLTGRLGLSWLGDVVDKRFLLAASLAVMGLTMIGISQAQSQWLAVSILVVYSVPYGGTIVLPVALQADYFGRHSFATIRGLIHTVQTAGMLVGPVLAGLIYEATDSYSLAFTSFAAAAFLAALMLLGVRKPTSSLS